MTSRADIASIRGFTRRFTQAVGVLDERYLGTSRPLGEARLIDEIGCTGTGTTVSTLRTRLGLDSGYLSRLLRALERDGLVTIRSDPADRRRRLVTLTTDGRDEWHRLENGSRTHIESLIEPLGHRTARLAELLHEADRLMAAATADFHLVDPASSDAVAAVRAYFAELDDRFHGGFDGVGEAARDAGRYREPHGGFVVLSIDGAAVGCGAFETLDHGVAEIKRMWIGPSWRGLGLASRLLSDLEQRCRTAGHHTVRLDTNRVLTEAVAMYRRSGYHPIERYSDNPYAHHWFERSLSED